MIDIQLDTADSNDLAPLCRLLALLFEQEQEFTADTRRQHSALQQLLAQPQQASVLVARHQQQVIGMVCLHYGVSTALGGTVATLEDMIVDPDWRGHHVGSRLLRHAIATAQQHGCLRLTLLTDGDNRAGQRFYSRHGFALSAMQPMRLLL